ncbi:MAG: VanW family protein [Caldilineaceae bacterium]
MYTIAARPLPTRRFERGAFDFALIFASLLLVTLISVASFWHMWYLERIYPGVTIAGISVGGLTRSAALSKLQSEAGNITLPPVRLGDGERQWLLDNRLLSSRAEWTDALNRAYLLGRSGVVVDDFIQQFTMLFAGESVMPHLEFDEGQLRVALNNIAQEARRPAQAGINFIGIAIPAQPGVEVDIEQSLAQLVNALHSMDLITPVSVPLQLLGVQPEAPSGSTSKPDALANLPATGLQVHDATSGLSFALDASTLRRIIAASEPFTVDEQQLRNLIGEWAKQVDIAPRDARLAFNSNSGEVTVLRPSQSGRKLDIDATYESIRNALANKSAQAELKVTDAPPAVDSNNIANMGIRELIVSASTYFKGSSLERIHNIQVGASKFEGVVVPPDGIFSFNHSVEDVSLANGFEDSLVIVGDATVNGVGGGICQVSTTVFRAALYGGFPIVERYNHSYIVHWYGEPGVDATIFTPGVDFRFRNDTGAYLLIEPAVDAENGVITFNFYGTKPNRQVSVSQPIIEEVKNPPAPRYELDNSLPEGTIKQVEWETKGMTVKIVRTINDANGTRSGELVSKYTAWGAVYKYGPNANVPNADSSAAEAPLPTPTEAPTGETIEG